MEKTTTKPKIANGVYLLGANEFEKYAGEEIPPLFHYSKNEGTYSVYLYRAGDEGDVMDGIQDKYIASYGSYFIIWSTPYQEFVEQIDTFVNALDAYNKLAETIKNTN